MTRRKHAVQIQGRIEPERARKIATPDQTVATRLQRLAGNRAVSELLLGVSQPQASLAVQRLVGLAKQSRIARARRTRVVWNATGSELDRARDYAVPALAALRDASIPVPAVVDGNPATGYATEFRPGHWDFLVNVGKFRIAPADTAAERKLVGDFYHEARHADQWFLAARYLAQKPRAQLTADEDYVRRRVKGTVWDAARQDPPPVAGRLTPARSRRKYADAAARAAGYAPAFAHVQSIPAAWASPQSSWLT